MDAAAPEPACCPSCRAPVVPGEPACWLCQRPLPAEPGPGPVAGTPGAGPDAGTCTPPPPAVAARRSFTLGSMMLLIALIAVCLGVTRESAGLGILLMLVVAPALIRTLFVSSRRERAGRSQRPIDKLVAFVASFAIIGVTWLAACAAFVATCLPTGLATLDMSNGWSLVPAIALGLIAAIWVFFVLVCKLWSIRD